MLLQSQFRKIVSNRFDMRGVVVGILVQTWYREGRGFYISSGSIGGVRSGSRSGTQTPGSVVRDRSCGGVGSQSRGSPWYVKYRIPQGSQLLFKGEWVQNGGEVLSYVCGGGGSPKGPPRYPSSRGRREEVLSPTGLGHPCWAP